MSATSINEEKLKTLKRQRPTIASGNPKMLAALDKKIAELEEKVGESKKVEAKTSKPAKKETAPKKVEKKEAKKTSASYASDFHIGESVSYTDRETGKKVTGKIIKKNTNKGTVFAFVESKERTKWVSINKLTHA
jgi:ribosomal protein L35AE/L33A